MIIWRGAGLLVPVFVVLVFVVMQVGLDGVFGEGTYRGEGWPLWLTVGIASLVVGVFGLAVNRRGDDGAQANRHALFFVPVQYWALLLPLLIGGFQYMEAQNHAQNALYAAEPQVGDQYLMDFSNAFEDVDPDFPYGAMKVVAVNSTGVKVVLSQYTFENRSGIRKALREDEEKGRFDDSSDFHFAFEEIEALVATDDIFDIQRL